MPREKQRGPYAKYLCLNCRSRKIKCAFHPSATVVPGPQPEAQGCQRCRNKQLECIIARTVLGRPPHQRTAVATSNSSIQLGSHETWSTDTVPAGRDATINLEHFLLALPEASHSDEDLPPSPLATPPSALEKSRGATSPMGLLQILLERDETFASAVVALSGPPTLSVNKLLDARLVEALDKQYVPQVTQSIHH